MADELAKLDRATEKPTFLGWQTTYGFFTQIWIGRLRFHVFHRPDPGEALHSHPWRYTSIPLRPYVEEYLDPDGTVRRQVIRRLRLNRQPATHTHRILGRWSGEYRDGEPTVIPGAVPTICWRGPVVGKWHYWRKVKGNIRRYDWRQYLRHVGHRPSKQQEAP